MATILITANGSMSCECIAEALHKEGHRLIGTNFYPSSWVGVDSFFHKIYKLAYANDDNYIPELLEICIKENVEYIFPLTDYEVDVLSKQRHLFENKSIILCMPNPKCIEIARSKARIAEVSFNLKNVQTIPTFLKNEINQLDLNEKIVAKLIHGRSSEKQSFFNSKDELLLHLKNNPGEDYVFQNFIDGDIYTVDYIRDFYKNDFSCVRQELFRTKNGAGLSVHVVEEAILSQATSAIGNVLDVCGVINIEFIYSNNIFYLLDINPRFSAGIAFSELAGYSFVLNHLRCFQKQSIENTNVIKTNFTAVKRYITYISAENLEYNNQI